jgi:hypothetical protein
VLREHCSPEQRERESGSRTAPFIVPVGAGRLLRDVSALQTTSNNAIGEPILFIFGDKTFGSRESAALEQNDETRDGDGAPPILVHHSAGNVGCISASVDLELIARLVREVAVLPPPGHIMSPQVAASVETRAARAAECEICSNYVHDRANGMGGAFDVCVCASQCVRSVAHPQSAAFSSCPEISVTDIESCVEIAVAHVAEWTAGEIVALLTLAEFDAGVCSALCWPLARKLNSRDHQWRRKAVEAVLRCHSTCFEVVAAARAQEQTEAAFEASLKAARWFYVVGAYAQARAVLDSPPCRQEHLRPQVARLLQKLKEVWERRRTST